MNWGNNRGIQMKIELTQGGHYITLTTESARDHYLLGRISGRLNTGTFSDGDKRRIDIPVEDLVKALAGEK